MSKKIESYNKRKVISSYFSVTLSITLVLFLLGALAFLVLSTRKTANHFKEQITISIFIKNSASQTEIKSLENYLANAEFTKSVSFISKEKAMKEYEKELGVDFIDVIGENPIQNAIDLNLKSEFVSPEFISKVVKKIENNTIISDISYDRNTATKIYHNLNKITLIVLSASAFFILLAILLINSSIRLSIYSKRFIIKTMQMVGATKSFIRAPFIYTNIVLGIISSVLASGLLYACLFYTNTLLPDLQLLKNQQIILIVFSGIFIGGIFICWISTFFATQRLLNLHTDELY